MAKITSLLATTLLVIAYSSTRVQCTPENAQPTTLKPGGNKPRFRKDTRHGILCDEVGCPVRCHGPEDEWIRKRSATETSITVTWEAEWFFSGMSPDGYEFEKSYEIRVSDFLTDKIINRSIITKYKSFKATGLI